MATLERIAVDGRALAAGDVIMHGGRRLQIEAISHTELIPRVGHCRWAYARNLKTNEVEPLVLSNFHLGFTEVVEGAKLEAARLDTRLTVRMPSGRMRWVGA